MAQIAPVWLNKEQNHSKKLNNVLSKLLKRMQSSLFLERLYFQDIRFGLPLPMVQNGTPQLRRNCMRIT